MAWMISRRLMEAYENSHSLPVLAAASSEASCSDGAQCAPSSGMPTPQAFLLPDKTTSPWRRFPSGMIVKHLTDDLGEGVLMWCQAAFPARTSAVREKEQESTGKRAACGNTWRELSVRFDLNMCLWKTHRCLFDEVLPESSVTLPKWGMMQGGALWERTMSEQITTGTGYGYLPTPVASECRDTWSRPVALAKLYKGDRVARFLCKTWLNFNLEMPERVALNPCWQEERMMFPIGWTGLKPLEMRSIRGWLNSHGIFWEGNHE